MRYAESRKYWAVPGTNYWKYKGIARSMSESDDKCESLALLVLLLVLNGNYMNKSDEEFELRLRPRVTETVSIEIPADTVESLKKVAASRDMSMEALLKFYIGQSLRQDLAELFKGAYSRHNFFI